MNQDGGGNESEAEMAQTALKKSSALWMEGKKSIKEEF
jgi:hypothetical protein